MLNSQYKDYQYGVWGVYVNSQVDQPIIIEGRYKDVVEAAKTMDGWSCDDGNIQRMEYRKIGERPYNIEEVWIAKYDVCPNGVMGIEWSGPEGFGRCAFVLGDDGKLHADTEHMANPNDKCFVRDLLTSLIDTNIVIDE